MSQKKGGRRESGNPAVRASGPSPRPAPSTPSGSWRQRFERRSAPFLVMLARQPRWLFPILMAVLLVAGLMAPVPWVGGALLALLVLVLVWLTVLSWPALTAAGRLLRVITVVAALAVAFMRLTGSL